MAIRRPMFKMLLRVSAPKIFQLSCAFMFDVSGLAKTRRRWPPAQPFPHPRPPVEQGCPHACATLTMWREHGDCQLPLVGSVDREIVIVVRAWKFRIELSFGVRCFWLCEEGSRLHNHPPIHAPCQRNKAVPMLATSTACHN